MKINIYLFRVTSSKHRVPKFNNSLRTGLFIAGSILLLTGKAGFGQPVKVLFTTPSKYVWTCPFGVTKAVIECWGAGGAGGGGLSNTSDTTAGGGGGGGGFVIDTIDVVPYTNYTVVVGAGGVAVPAANGGAGGSSWFSSPSTVYAPAGKGGFLGTNGINGLGVGGAGGSADSCIPSTYAVSGTGGCSAFINGEISSGAGGPGAGGYGVVGCSGETNPNGAIGNNGNPIGGGGEGAIAGPVISIPFGGNGADGQVIITYIPALPVVNFFADNGFYEVFPNPTNGGRTTVRFKSKESAIYILNIFDLTGREIINREGKSGEGIYTLDLDLNGYSKGLYLLVVQSGDNRQLSKLIVE